ncbi:4-hydroxythreonine-4-phosphate dehydrogenase PdxA [Akkermansiaceae bacterium]|nr:4-hydroxythreonine-4-phosphate dehydrogenase PdxA [Akkermansiaceae bacterium]MDA7888858.1 4-hydroxythreonine-4-phosphate dehydrogenase PdxA [Akkermansiaceae bacterium]
MKAPLIITQGDPAGVGPELALRVLADNTEANLKVIGCRRLLGEVAKRLSLPIDAEQIIDLPLEKEISPGQVSAAAGDHSFRCLEAAVEGALAGDFSGLVTNPINKEAWDLAGHPYPGHTEYLVEKTNSPRHAMMLTSEEITCALITTHVALADVPSLLEADRMLEVIELTHEAMSTIKGRPAKLAMPGLNPHAGENGLFGREEIELIIPVLEKARAQGIDIIGPMSPDTAFLPDLRKTIDAYVCTYHDQGLIPLKTLAFDLGVNVTLGLPIVRTSVDHGTAFDIAWQGKASATSLHEAVNLARRLSV